MRAHNVGKTALYTLNYEPIVRRTGIFRPQETTVGSRPAFEKAGEGWVITEADRYSDSTFSWIALDEEPPRLFQCTGPILSETQHTENRQHPPYPYAYVHGALRHEVFVYTDQDAEILARAALRLTAQGQ